jgi:hypothetical protein
MSTYDNIWKVRKKMDQIYVGAALTATVATATWMISSLI